MLSENPGEARARGGPSPPPEARLSRALVVTVLLVEAILVVGYERREIVWAYPSYHDQASYLSVAYEDYETIRRTGLIEGFSAAIRRPSPNGLLLPLEASVFFFVTGPTRLSALFLVFLHFAALQIAVAWSATRLAGRGRAALLAVGLLLTARSPWFWAGGVTDFRLDLPALSLYGVFLCVVLRSGVFLSAGWSAAAGVAAAVCILTRFLTAAYVGPVLILALVVLLVQRYKGEAFASHRLRGVALTMGTAAVISGPLLFLKGSEVYRYYVVGHLLTDDGRIRAALAGSTDLPGALAYYPWMFVRVHPGPVFLAMAAFLLGAAFRAREGPGAPDDLAKRASLFLLSALLVPLVVLTLDADRSPVVSGIAVPPLLLLVLACALPRIGLRTLTLATGSALVLGLSVSTFFLLRSGPGTRQRPELEELDRLCDAAFTAADHAGRSEIRLSVDRMSDTFDAQVFRVMAYERHGVLLGVGQELWTGIHPVTKEEAAAAIDRSDLVLLTVREDTAAPLFPFDRSMQELGTQLFGICRARFITLGRFRIPGREVELFSKLPGPGPA